MKKSNYWLVIYEPSPGHLSPDFDPYDSLIDWCYLQWGAWDWEHGLKEQHRGYCHLFFLTTAAQRHQLRLYADLNGMQPLTDAESERVIKETKGPDSIYVREISDRDNSGALKTV